MPIPARAIAIALVLVFLVVGVVVWPRYFRKSCDSGKLPNDPKQSGTDSKTATTGGAVAAAVPVRDDDSFDLYQEITTFMNLQGKYVTDSS